MTRGARVTILPTFENLRPERGYVQARVIRAYEKGFTARWKASNDGEHVFYDTYENEGLTWARGWTRGVELKAFKARMPLTRMCRPGEKITVQIGDEVFAGRVQRGRGARITWTAGANGKQRSYWGQIARGAYGKTWVRGWDTPEALAMRAAAAL